MGMRIKERRKAMGIRQMELAERVDISSNHMSSIENGREKPSIDLLMELCEVLSVTPDYLLLGAIHSNDVPQNIYESLRLCDKRDLEVIKMITEAMVKHNSDKWNDEHMV